MKFLANRMISFIALAALVAVLTHALWTGIIVEYMRTVNPDRLPQIPKLKKFEDRIGLIAAYFEEHSKGADKIAVIAGSSLSMGYSMAADKTYAARIRDPIETRGYRLINMSVMALSPEGIVSWIGCPLYKLGRKVDLAIIEMPIVNHNTNILAKLKQKDENGESVLKSMTFPTLEKCPDNPIGSNSYYSYFWHRPYGVQWIPLLWDEFRQFNKDEAINLTPLPQEWLPNTDHYAEIRGKVLRDRADTVTIYKQIAKDIVVFNSPLYIPGLTQLGFDRINMMQQFKDGIAFCQSKAQVHCIDTSSLINRSSIFRDVAHLGVNGHAFFAEWLLGRIEPQL
jgi:hypothetical protein